MENKNNPVSLKELRHFGWLVGAVLGGLFGVFFPWLFERAFPPWPWLIAVPLIVLGTFSPSLLRGPYRAWMFLGNILNWINTRIILTLLFFLVFAPLGFLARLLGWDPMGRKSVSHQTSYRIQSKQLSLEQMERPY